MLIQIYLLFVHWVGDYIGQDGKMALGKGKSIYWLNIHVSVYFLILTIGTFILYFSTNNYEFVNICKFLLLNGPLHWITDYFTSRLATHLREKNDDRHYWVTGFDQFIHSSTIIYTYNNILI